MRLSAKEVAGSAVLGVAVFVGLSACVWAIIAAVTSLIEDDVVNNAVTLGVPVAWVAGLVVAGSIARSKYAAAGGYLIASTGLVVVGAVALARATEGVSIDAGGGAGLLAVPMLVVAFFTLTVGVTLVIVAFIFRR